MSLTLSSTAWADDEVNKCFTDFQFPQPTTTVLQDGSKAVCWPLPELVEIVDFTNCGINAANKLNVCEGKNKKLEHQATLLKEMNALLAKNNEILKTEKTRLFKRWEEENKRRHAAENKADWSWLGWTAAGVFAVSTATLGVIIIVK